MSLVRASHSRYSRLYSRDDRYIQPWSSQLTLGRCRDLRWYRNINAVLRREVSFPFTLGRGALVIIDQALTNRVGVIAHHRIRFMILTRLFDSGASLDDDQWSPKIAQKHADGGNVMQHLPKQAQFLGRALKACFDCTQQPLPDELNVVLGLLDGAERRRRIQATINTRPMVKLDLPAGR